MSVSKTSIQQMYLREQACHCFPVLSSCIYSSQNVVVKRINISRYYTRTMTHTYFAAMKLFVLYSLFMFLIPYERLQLLLLTV